MNEKLLTKKRMRRFIRYLIIFLVVFISTQYIPECSITYITAFIIGTIASMTFAILDMYFPLLI